MRPSPFRHPLAVLRHITGISQKEMAALVGRTPATVQAIELGKLALSEQLALKIALETGVAVRWLLNGDPSVAPFSDDRPIFSDETGNFSKADFERRRADRAAGRSGWSELIFFPGVAGARVTAIEHAAVEHPNRNIAAYRISKFLEGLEKEFGLSKEHLDTELLKQKLWRDFENLFEDPDSEIGQQVSASYREFVPALIKRYKSLIRTFKNRTEKDQFQRPGIFPLIQWAFKALHVISPQQPHKLLLKVARKNLKPRDHRSRLLDGG
jgi:transcriptional regulator with XRE-family HTH domain